MSTRKTPFYAVNVAAGGDMRELFGYYLPLTYGTGHEAEHTGTRERASLCDLDYMAQMEIKGSQALDFVQTLLTADCAKQKTGQIKYTAICREDGNMVDDGTIWRMGEQEFVLVTGDESDYAWVSRQAKAFDVTVKNLTAEWTTLALQGPLTEGIAKKLVDVDLTGLKYYHFIKCAVDGVDVILARMGYTGERGFEFHFHPRYAEKMWNIIMDAGKEAGIVPCGQAALESLRQEAGYLLVGNDHDKNTNPFEAGIGFAVGLEKESFTGKEALAAIAAEGVKRRLCWFRVKGGAVAETGDAIYLGGKRVGTVTSGSYSFTRRGGTAMGYVSPRHAVAGLTYQIETGGKRCGAVLSVMPLYDPGDYNTKI